MKYIFKLKLLFNIKQFKYITIGILILLSANTAWSQHQCTGECYVEPDYTTTITTTLPFDKNETEVTVSIKDGIAYYQGDIVLGKLSDLLQKGVARDNLRWTNSTIPYAIAAGFSATEINKINNAAASITANTNLCVIPRTTETNFVNVIPDDGCSSFVGMIGGAQNLWLAPGCGFGSTIHEFLHAAGIWHEQSREDRNTFVTINWANIEPGRENNFDQQITGSTDYGNYDYGSLMHYGATAFSVNGLPTITTIPAGIPIGQRTALSAGDIATVNAIYPNACGACSTNQTVTTNYGNGSNIDIEVSNTITASNKIYSGANVDYDAGNLVRLTTGFHAYNGSTFHAFNDGCGGALIVSEEDDTPDTEEYALKSNTETMDISDFTLRNYPNPFTGQTTIEYNLPNDSRVMLVVTDFTGKQIAVLVNNEQRAKGLNISSFDGSDYPAGMYYYTIQAGNRVETQKMTLVK